MSKTFYIALDTYDEPRFYLGHHARRTYCTPNAVEVTFTDNRDAGACSYETRAQASDAIRDLGLECSCRVMCVCGDDQFIVAMTSPPQKEDE